MTKADNIVAQLRGRLKFYAIGDPVRLDMQTACEVIEAFGVGGEDGDRTPDSVSAWLDERGVTLLPWQRKRLGLDPRADVASDSSGQGFV